jgi:hypothetical protein
MMRALLVVAVLATPVAAGPTATVTIDHGTEWRAGNGKPVKVRIGGGAWQKVASGQASRPLAIAVTSKRAIAIDVQVPGMKPFRRWVALVPDASYRMVGNPCAIWGLDVDAEADRPERFRIDARGLPPRMFPIVISTVDYPDTGSAETAILDKPGMSAAVEMHVSAMCSRSGGRLTVRSKPTKQVLLDETLIAHPGRLHTITLAKPGFELVVESAGQ